MQTPEECQISSRSLCFIFGTGSPSDPGPLFWLVCQDNELSGATCLCPTALRLWAHVAMPSFYVGTQDLNSGLLAYTISVLTQ